MSKNISALSYRKGLDKGLFEALSKQDVNSDKNTSTQQIAKDFLIGEAIVKGSRSFYDFIEGSNAQKQAYVCNGSSCLCAETQPKVVATLLEQIEPEKIGHVACLGRCYDNAAFQINGNNYSGKDIENITSIIQQETPSGDHWRVFSLSEQPILTAQLPPLNDFYRPFKQHVLTRNADDVLQEIIDSGLRGRGGAGFPAGIKWQACKNASSDEKYVVCNADEGDPGAFTDRYLLEQRPHLVLYGMLVAGHLVGAKTGILYIRDEYPESIAACEMAITELDQLNFDFRFKIVRGAGAYICGEETALLRSIEGQRPIVSTRPPFPVTQGLFEKPTVLNNVETFASIHWIIEHGGEAFNARGNRRSTGTKLLSLDNAFNQPGVYEVDMNTALTTVIEAAGGYRVPIKALHIGGPLGGLVPLSKVDDLSIDFESFAENGFLLGHASIIGIPENLPMIEYMAHLFEFTAAESCGKCFPCRLGATRGHEMVKAAIEGKQPIPRELLDDLLETMELGSLCALGGGVPLPIKNMLQYFSDELQAYLGNPANPKIQIQEVY